MDSRQLVLLTLLAIMLVTLKSNTVVDAAPNKILMRFGKRTLPLDRNLDEWITEKDLDNLHNLYYLLRESGEQ
uniref:Neuropeptide n=1 Tax=Ascaris lumbricoides TaxID=6252 RepID=A0A0M3HR36_ASCLU